MQRLSTFSDEEWLRFLKQDGVDAHQGEQPPLLPPSHIQELTVGLVGGAALDQGYAMYRWVKSQAEAVGSPLRRGVKVLDFGCGWGRMTRFFAKDVAEENLFGVDVDAELLEICRASRVVGSYHQCRPRETLPFRNGFFDIVYSYSVFSHLSEDIQIHSVSEIHRVLRPGGLFICSVQPRRFIEAIGTFTPEDSSSWRRSLSRYANHVPELLAQYDLGRFVFLPGEGDATRSASDYGDAIAPSNYFEATWAPWFKIVEHNEDTGVLWQSVVTAQKLWQTRLEREAPTTSDSASDSLRQAASELIEAARHLAKAMSLLGEAQIPVAPSLLATKSEQPRSERQRQVSGPAAFPQSGLGVNDQSLSEQLIHKSRPPAHYYIDIGNVCNLRCPFCPTGNGKTKIEQSFMSIENFKIVMENIRPHARLVSLYNWGEPFLHPKLLEMISLASETAHVHIDSNLSSKVFTLTFAKDIVRSGLRSLFASVDGVSQEVYEKYRVKGDVARVFKNLETLCDAKKGIGSDLPHIGWLYHVSRFNQEEMDEASAKAAAMGVPIVFKRLSSPDPAWWSSYHFDSEMVLDGEWFNTVYAPPRNQDLSRIELHPNVREPCRQLFETMTIQWNGDVLPCTCVEGPEYTMGNMIRDGLDAVWNGPQFQKSRRFVLNYGPQQHTGSVCENHECPVAKKHIT